MTTPLIPRATLFGNPDRASPQISPDGRHLAWLAPHEGVLNVWVAPADAPDQAEVRTNDRVRGIRSFAWAFDGDHLLYVQDKGGNEDWHVYAARIDGVGDERDLTPFEGVQARIIGRSRNHPGVLLLGMNDRNPQLHDVYTVEIATGERTLVHENPGLLTFLADDDYNLVVGATATPDGGLAILTMKDGAWAPIASVPQTDAMTTAPFALDASGRTLYLLDSRERDTGAAFAWDLDSGERTLIAEDPRADVDDLLMHPTRKTIQAVASTYTRTRWQVLDDDIQPDLDALGELGGEVNVLSRDDADRVWTVALVQDDGPVRYVRWDRPTQTATHLFTNRTALEGVALAPMQALVLPARDGLELVSYLTLPLDSDPEGTGRPTAPVPLVLVVHGGPWARDSWGYNPVHQWLANRGYAVLSVNFRGSTGFGKAFTNAGDHEWAGKMHDDLLDAVQWAIDERITTAEQVGILGGSYGGYATLVGLTFTPETFACGVDIVGPSNLLTLIESVPEYWKPLLTQMTTRIGDPETDEGHALLVERSPLTRVDAIRRPLLIGQGANDPRVKQAESDQIVEAMQDKGIPYTYVLFPDEGHGFARPENNIAFWALAEKFLAEHLRGRVEPITDELDKSTAEVTSG